MEIYKSIPKIQIHSFWINQIVSFQSIQILSCPIIHDPVGEVICLQFQPHALLSQIWCRYQQISGWWVTGEAGKRGMHTAQQRRQIPRHQFLWLPKFHNCAAITILCRFYAATTTSLRNSAQLWILMLSKVSQLYADQWQLRNFAMLH